MVQRKWLLCNDNKSVSIVSNGLSRILLGIFCFEVVIVETVHVEQFLHLLQYQHLCLTSLVSLILVVLFFPHPCGCCTVALISWPVLMLVL